MPNMRVQAGALIVENNSILLIECISEGETETYYTFPGGRIKPKETVTETVKRKVKEETGVDIDVGGLALISEYAPHFDPDFNDSPHVLTLVFECKVKDSSKLAELHKQGSVKVKPVWVPISKLNSIRFVQDIKSYIIRYLHNRINLDLIEEHKLGKYID